METRRNRVRLAVIVTAVVAVAALGLAAVIGITSGLGLRTGGGLASRALDEKRAFPPEGVARVVISGVSEPVRVVDSADGRFTASLSGPVRGGRRESVPRLAAAVEGGTLTVRVERRPLFFPVWDDLTLEVAVPRAYAGSLSVNTVSGELDVAGHAYGELSLVSTSGQVRVRFTAQPGRISITSTSGDVDLTLPAAPDFTLDARSTSGDIRCDFPILVTSARGEHALAGTVGTGRAAVRIETVSGDIRVTR